MDVINSGSRGIAWMSHSTLSMSKFQGGLGLRDLENFNLAMLSKIAWHLVHFVTTKI